MRFAAVLLLLACLGCRYKDPAFYTADGRRLESVEPIPYRLHVEPVEGLEAGEGGYRFVYDGVQAQARLAAHLRRFAAANEILLTADRADLVLRPRVARQASFGNPRSNSKTWIAGALWFTTWFGGLRVEDKTYDASMAFDFDLVNPHDGTTIDTFSAATDEIALTFRERNKGSTSKTVESMVAPPTAVYDKQKIASRALSERVLQHVAAVASGYLKQDFAAEERALLGEVKLLAPRNGADVGPEARLNVRLVAFEPITEAAVFLNDAAVPVRQWRVDEGLPPLVRQRRGSIYVADLETPELALAPGRNLVTFELRVAGRPSTRTLVFWNGKP